MMHYMLELQSEDDEKTIHVCNPQYGEGELITYQPANGIKVCYSDCQMKGPYEYQGKYDLTGILEINYCLCGKYECVFSDQTVVYLTDGDFLVWSGKGEVIALDSSYKRYKGITIYVDINQAAEPILNIIQNSNIDLRTCINQTMSGKTSIIAKPGAKIHHIFDELYDLPSKYALEYIRLKVIELLLLVYTDDFQYEESVIKHYPRTLVQAAKDTKQYIENYFPNHITIADLAHRNYVNTSQLTKCFKYIYGMTINECLQYTRMTKALELVTNTDFKVTDIALLVGYSNASKFSDAFKRFFGDTPVKYRKRIGTEKNIVSEHF